MRYHDIQITGSLNISGSITIPVGGSNLKPTSPPTGSIFLEISDSGSNLVVFNGSGSTGYQQVGVQTVPVAPPITTDLEYVAIAGGGSGGGGAAGSGGAGGAGGYLSSSISSVESGSSFTITIGAGSATAALNTKGGAGSDSTIAGSSISTITANGGGLGGYDSSNAGGDGGSGGGGSTNNGSFSTGGSGTVGQGNDGGDGASLSVVQWAAGGGGGAGSAGETAEGNNNAGEGGSGLTSKITGTGVERAGGGGGGAWNSSAHGTATGGGGNGGGGSGNAGTAGTANTGGGGGGGGQDAAGGTGGSGVVVLAYPTGSATGQGGVKTSRSDGHFVHTFNESGTFTLGGSDFHTIAPTENFNVVTYTGTGASAAINVGFEPGLVWWKERNGTNSHQIYDLVRSDHKALFSNTTGGEYDYSGHPNGDLAPTFTSTGFNTPSVVNNGINRNGGTYVAWCWKAGGTATSNSNGTITSSVSANTKAGFSITKYTGNGTAGASVGHGLTSKPELIIWKNFDATANWLAYADDLATSHEWLYLNATNELQTSGTTNEYPTNKQRPTNSVVYLNGAGSSNNINISGEDTIMYCFHSVSGYQKIGTYTGASGDITVTTGFRPKFVMVKRTNSTGHWEMHDSVRFSTIKDENGASSRLRANENSSEGSFNNSPIFFTETGFTLDSSVSANSYGDYDANGSTYLYLAISE